MKMNYIQMGGIDYIDRPTRPSYFDPRDGCRDEEGSIESGLTVSTRFDGEDPRYSKTITQDMNDVAD